MDWRPRAERAKRNQRKVANLPNRTSSPSSAVVVGMPTRITLRLMGAANGKKASLPIGATMADLHALATTKLALPQPAKRVFDASGDELDDDGDVALVTTDDVLYVSCGEDFRLIVAEPSQVLREARSGALRSRRTSPPSLRGPRADVCTRHRSLALFMTVQGRTLAS